MTFTVREFNDLIKILDTQPEWRNQMRRALFPEIDLPKALQELADAQRQTEEALHRLEAAIDRLTAQQEKMDRDVRDLKGLSHERTYRDKAASIFGRLIRNGHDVTNQVADRLYDALVAGQVTEDDIRQVLAVDLLWGGEERATQTQLLFVLEASWLAEMHDVERAFLPATILRRVGLSAIPVVGGREWSDKVIDQALLRGVMIITNGHIDRTSWESAWSKLKEQRV